MQDFLQVFVNGLIAGSMVALLAVSYSLVYSVLRFINFTFGEILMFSAYGFFLLKVRLELNIWLALGTTVLLAGLLGALVQIGAYRPLYRRSRLACLITALGVSLLLQNVALLIFNARPKTLRGHVPDGVVDLGGVVLNQSHLLMCGTALVLLILAEIFVFRSRAGLRVRALTDNMAMAELLGVPVDRTIAAVFVLGSTFAAASGILLSFEHLLKPTMGISPGIQAFAACVVGGIGSIRGAVVMAFVIAGSGHFVTYAWPLVTPATSSYAILLLALALFPRGLFPTLRSLREHQRLIFRLPFGTPRAAGGDT